jgi:hypothetical protein
MVDHAPVDENWTLGSVYNVEEEFVISIYANWSLECAALINEALQAWGSTPRRLRVNFIHGGLRKFQSHTWTKTC